MDEPNPLNKLKKPKYHTLFPCMLGILALILLSLFPSQTPQFLNHIITSKLWELIHLIFIGIGVCYGLFGRRNTQIEPILDANERYLYGVLKFSSILDHGFENVKGCDEKLLVQYPENGCEIQSTLDKKIMSQTQNYEYEYARKNDVLNNLGKTKLVDYHNPLNLPVRSLRSKLVKTCDAESVEEIRTNLGTVRFCEENDKNKKAEIRGLIPINLEKKFQEAALPSPIPWSSRPSRVEMGDKFKPLSHKMLLSVIDEKRSKETRPCRNQVGTDVNNVGFSSHGDFEFEKFNSQSIPNTMEVLQNRGGSELNENMCQTSLTHLGALPAKELDFMKVDSKFKQMKVRDEKRNAKSPPCFRPSSVGNSGNYGKKLKSMIGGTEARGKKDDAKSPSQSESFWSSIFSPVNSGSHSPNKSSHLSPILTEDQNPKLEDLKKNDNSFSSISKNTPQFGNESSPEKNLERNCDITLKIFDKFVREENREKMKHAAPTKSLPRGKSVRTIRTEKNCLLDKETEESFSVLMDENVEKTKGHKLENVSLDEISKSSEYHNKRQVSCRLSKGQTEKEIFGDLENFKANSSEGADSAIADNEELDSDEVDKKADAFIAKFREQIRLQKIDSIKKKTLID